MNDAKIIAVTQPLIVSHVDLAEKNIYMTMYADGAYRGWVAAHEKFEKEMNNGMV